MRGFENEGYLEMEEQDYLSRPIKTSEGTFKDRGSKFLAFVFPVKEVEEVPELIQEVKKKYYDARHHCVAYRIGIDGEHIYTNDDGEPGNTAGAPILAAIRSAELTDILIVVVRYFGGTKLGVRGLIEAYRGAAADAIEQGAFEKIIPKTTFTIDFTYPQTSEVNRILHRFETEKVEAIYTDRCSITLSILSEKFDELKEQFELARIPLTEKA